MKRLLLVFSATMLLVATIAGPVAAQGDAPAAGDSPAPAAGNQADGGDAEAPAAAPGGGGSVLLPMLIIFALFYFIMLRPGRSREKDRAMRVTSIEKHNQVITRGGIIGKVVAIDEQHQELTIVTDEKTDTRLVLSRSGIWDLYEPPDPAEPARR